MKKVYQKGRRKPIKASNAIDPATTVNKDWGFSPVPNKGGMTTNYAPPVSYEKEEK